MPGWLFGPGRIDDIGQSVVGKCVQRRPGRYSGRGEDQRNDSKVEGE